MSIKDRNIEDLPLVCVMGLGFVGAAMATAVASSCDKSGASQFRVVGVDLPSAEGLNRIQAINAGRFPFESSDQKLFEATKLAHDEKLLSATSDTSVYSQADIVLVDVNCDVKNLDSVPSLDMNGFKKAMTTLGESMKPGSLLIVETTVPPGTCKKIAAPILKDCLTQRGLEESAIMLAHSYERVMPGFDYYDSIVNFWRVFAGHTSQAAEACESFLSKVINTKDFPLTRLATTTASETAKVLENSYRAVNIAFIEEWGRFAEASDVDLFEVLQAIRMRPTHSNIRQPGFGVGGYCLTKDPLFTGLAAKEIFDRKDLDFPFSTQAVKINNKMPLVSLDKIEKELGTLKGKKILLMGVSYRQDVGDTRHSPSEIFTREALARGATVDSHDPLVKFWREMNSEVLNVLPHPSRYDAVVFAVQHGEYLEIQFDEWLKESKPLIFDSNNVLSQNQLRSLKTLGLKTSSIGRGEFS